MKKTIVLFPLLALIIYSCQSLVKEANEEVKLVKVESNLTSENKYTYQASEKRIFDLLHTSLDVTPVWERQELEGKAILTLRPYFYSTNTLTLDAKGMMIKSVGMLDTADQFQSLKFEYDSLQIQIKLPIKYARTDTFRVQVEYISKPNELAGNGSKAINDDKGLYFINPLGRDQFKPQQIWTQGETEAASVWFPTIDAPNEKTTQEIKITVDPKYSTLSNGLLISRKINANGTRTDYWKQSKRHAPYLFMMAVGEFAVIKDSWRGIAVNYLVPPKDSAYARGVFGNTPEMLTFYSDVLGYDYPWDKYNQIVVSDYVSGAMENTGAVIHGKWVFTTPEQQVDENHEDVVAHELFHHWFGDLVTCESWSNLPLNESFATYGEYLWIEHKYGKVKADRHLRIDMLNYFADTPRVDLIRFHYNDKEDMFDRHTYEKGGRILHMLRNLVGDEAFFESLKLYLHTNEFNSVEIHQLRLAFEEVTGMDLNVFFNQWFLNKGHPVLDVRYESKSDSLLITVKQDQSASFPTFEFPVSIDIYAGGKPKRKEIFISKREETFLFKGLGDPEAINFDAEKVLLAKVNQGISPESALVLFQNGKNYGTKLEALLAINRDTSVTAWELLNKASKDTFEHFRKISYYLWNRIDEGKTEQHKEKLLHVFRNDLSAHVRLACLNSLGSSWSEDSTLIPLYKKALKDSSVNVKLLGLELLSDIAREDALLRAYQLENLTDARVITTLARIYADVRDESKRKWYNWALKQVEARNKKYVIGKYATYLLKKGNEVVWKGCEALEEEAIYENNKDVRGAAGLALHSLRNRNIERILDIRRDIKDKKESSRGKPYDLKLLEEKHKELLGHEERLIALIIKVVEAEVNQGIKNLYTENGLLDTELPAFEEIPAEEALKQEEKK
ncbi:MAG: aminopeptidase N [Flavobacteriales bacterium]|jgi:aminopeptidase N|tara:strand:- start:11777 stop:14482 length:2706 start_codon:yes stop_codon:yes gene_type:complete